MIKILQLFYFFIFSSQIVLAQQGQYMIRNYTPSQQQSQTVSWAIRQDDRGFIYVGSDEGLLEYDGVNWKQISTPYEVQALQLHKGYVYVGGKGGFGWIDHKSSLSSYHAMSTAHYGSFSVIQNVYVIRDTVYFYAPEGLYRLPVQSKNILGVIREKDGVLFSGSVQVHENLYINIPDKGLQLLNANHLVAVAGGEVLARTTILFSAPYTSKEVLLGTSDSRLYTFDGLNIKPFVTSADKLLAKVTMYKAAVLLHGQIALATSGGCFVLDKSGNLLQVINSQHGLASDAVNGVSADKDGGLWLAHDAGVSYAAVHLPVYDLNFSRIKSKINASVYFQQQLYIATDEGVLYLSAKEDKVIEKAPVVVSRKVESLHNNSARQEPVTTEEKAEKKFLGLFKRKQKNEHAEEQVNTPGNTVNITNITSHTIQQITQVYKEEGYKFRKISGINWKCRELVVVNNKLLVSTENGLFEINNQACKPVLPSADIYSLLPSEVNQGRIYAGTNAGLFVLEWEQGEWKIGGRARQLTAAALSLAEEPNGGLWIGAATGLYKLLSGASIEEAKVKKIDRFAGQPVQVKKLLQHNFVLTDQIIRQINPAAETFEVAPELQKYHSPHTLYAADKHNTIWISNADNSYRLTYLQGGMKEDTLYVLKMINGRITSIHFDRDAAYVATQKNIYKCEFNALAAAKSPDLFASIIRRVKVDKVRELENPVSQQSLTLTYQPEKYTVIFDFAAAAFDNQSAVMYQYILEGSSSKWSDWTRDTRVIYSNLDENTYAFKVRARNLHGKISEPAVFSIEIRPPFWDTWWFYSVEFLFFSLMIGLSFYLNKTKAETRMATILTFVSLFIVFEYIHVLIEPYVDNIAGGAPIFEILMNLLLASLLFPVEAYIRGMMKEKKISKAYSKVAFNRFKLS